VPHYHSWYFTSFGRYRTNSSAWLWSCVTLAFCGIDIIVLELIAAAFVVRVEYPSVAITLNHGTVHYMRVGACIQHLIFC
jgi:hypothetical protein